MIYILSQVTYSDFQKFKEFANAENLSYISSSVHLTVGRAKENIRMLSLSENEQVELYESRPYYNFSPYLCEPNRLLVNVDGDMYPCPLLTNKDYYLGKVSRHNINNIENNPQIMKLHTSTVDHVEHCSFCALRYLCSGGCWANKVDQQGSAYKKFIFCKKKKLVSSLGEKVMRITRVKPGMFVPVEITTNQLFI